MTRPPEPDKTGFYTAKGECIICNCPPEAAPTLMDFYEDPDGENTASTCFFKRQPKTAEELDAAIDAMSLSCVAAIRYGGDDPEIIRRLLRDGSEDCVDAMNDERRSLVLQQLQKIDGHNKASHPTADSA